MKNKLRLIANWIILLTLPLWFYIALVVFTIRDVRAHGWKAYKGPFLYGTYWWWE